MYRGRIAARLAPCNQPLHEEQRCKSNGRQIKGIAARAGHWSASHRKLAIWGWVALLVVAIFVGNSIPAKQLTDTDKAVGESGRAQVTLDKAFPQPAGEMVLVHSDKKTLRRRELPCRVR